MCGIVGYIGDKQVDGVILKALSRLEYRGYDSAGVALLHEGELSILKASGKLNRLREIAGRQALSGNMGIGHTRWATHGEPSERNAHPHADCTRKIAVVHNGIIENHAPLRQRLEEAGHRFESDTDTEVLAHLIEEYHLRGGRDLAHAVRTALAEIEGSYAFCVLSASETERFIAARNGSPLVVGLGRNENFVASDAPAILDFTRDVIFLEDYQMADVSRQGVKVTSVYGEPVASSVTRIEWDSREASKDGFESYMLKEIEEQPRVIERLLRQRLSRPLADSLFDILRVPAAEIRLPQRILIQACGTSWHAGLIGKFLLESLAGIPTEVDVSSEFRYRTILPQPGTLLLSITQSGETIDALMAMRKGKESGFRAVSICNVMGSTITRESDAVVYTHAGPEIGVASTKAYTAQITALVLLSLYWAQARGIAVDFDTWTAELRAIPEKMRSVLGRSREIAAIALKYRAAQDFLFLGRGVNYPSAHEGALKIKEIAYIHATGHPAGEMKHGPIALIDGRLPVVAIVPHTSGVYDKMLSNMQEVKARSGKIIAIATEGDEAVQAVSDEIFFVPATPELLSPLLTVIPLQYLAYHVAKGRGNDVDQPRNLAKSVTVE